MGSDADVTANDNKTQLENELIRLKNVEWFLTKFKALMKVSGVEFFFIFIFVKPV